MYALAAVYCTHIICRDIVWFNFPIINYMGLGVSACNVNFLGKYTPSEYINELILIIIKNILRLHKIDCFKHDQHK